MRKQRILLILLMALVFLSGTLAQETEVVYLSGTGFDRTVDWDFYCTAGMNSGTWTTIEVPSCWEQQGFGQYNYGHVPLDNRLKEEGHYRYFFEVPDRWKGNTLVLLFEGVMTDARVLVNGKQAGAVHQGGFYPFSYDISRLVRFGKKNKLEVFVKKCSDNASVNQAERVADYWVFGGIYRPVKLEIRPSSHISQVAVNALADGAFQADVSLEGAERGGKVLAEITTFDGRHIAVFDTLVEAGAGRVRVRGKVDRPLAWSPEFPHLYQVHFTLLDPRGTVLHRLTERIGFRTVEVREQDGIYVNGVRIKYKGVCRHSFHPDNGRTSSKAFSIEAVNLIKDMNMNAVRMSHYPPDSHFLDVCDSLGLFVLDELAGWQRPPYDSVIGRKLLQEMITRDVNHPSVVMWDNGNEGGWNPAYDADFRELDIQKRAVNHPWGVHDLTNTAHYVNYDYLAGDGFAPRSIFFPTEMIHGLYDGGLGAGLEDFWLRMWNDPLSAGGFLWVFADEGVKRTDTGKLDTDGNHAPDGILGPYHEKEGSFYAIRELWSPVYIEKRYITPAFNGTFRIQNRYHYTSLDQCQFRYHWIKLPGPGYQGNRDPDALVQSANVIDFGDPEVDPLLPGQNGILRVPLAEGWSECDVLYLEASDPYGRLINRWSWPVKSPATSAAQLLERMDTSPIPIEVSETGESLILASGGIVIELGKSDGMLRSVESGSWQVPLGNGPRFRADTLQIRGFRHFAGDHSHHVEVDYGRAGTLEWIFHEGGLMDMNLLYQPEGQRIPYTGASFSYPEHAVKSVTYVGDGPYRVWKNRMAGVAFHIWEKPYNNSITGYSGYEYPEFKGYYSNLYWARIMDPQGRYFTVYSHSNDLFLRLFTPEEAPQPAHTAVAHPPGDLSFMLGIPAIGTKFKEAEELGPQSRSYHYLNRRVKGGSLRIELTFNFRQSDP